MGHDALIDGAENGLAGSIEHFDTYTVSHLQERRSRPAMQQRLDHAHFREAGIAGAALADRQARTAPLATV